MSTLRLAGPSSRERRLRAKKEKGDELSPFPRNRSSRVASPELHLGSHGRSSGAAAHFTPDLALGATHLATHFTPDLTYNAPDAPDFALGATHLAFRLCLCLCSTLCHFYYLPDRGEGRLSSPFPVRIRSLARPRSKLRFLLGAALGFALGFALGLTFGLGLPLCCHLVPSSADEGSFLRLVQV